MTVANLSYKTPQVIGTEGINEPRVATAKLKLYASGSQPEISVGSWITPDGTASNGWVGVATNGDAVSHVVTKIFDASGNIVPQGYVPASTTTQYYVEAMPVGGLIFAITEDADTTPITDANSGAAGATYCDVIVSAMTGTTFGVDKLVGSVFPNIKLDSSGVSSSSSGKCVQLMGLVDSPDIPAYSATSLAAPRTFKCKVITAGASQ